jgi:hypothetical protein
MEYQISSPFSLKENASTSERWLQDRIIDDPSILGLGEVEIVASEKSLPNAGRLDLLLQDPQLNRRYEVELMLGPTNPSHIIRTIEYWDVERRRYPAYDHIAVIIAEDITTRFLNVMSLFAGSIPLVAIQLSALRVDERVILHFVRVLDQTELRVDDAYEAGVVTSDSEVDRTTWERKVGADTMEICDGLLSLANQSRTHPLILKYRKGRVTIGPEGQFFAACNLWPKQGFINIAARIDLPDDWIDRLRGSQLSARVNGKGRVVLPIRKPDLLEKPGLIREFLEAAISNNLSV